jgi:hypothetical protein
MKSSRISEAGSKKLKGKRKKLKSNRHSDPPGRKEKR